ncbi:MAG: hypothetical protein PWP08_1289 [Methanofollis sp.]|nr:hypothetical protein [Methanofollis sp.]
MISLLCVDDEPAMLNLIRRYLERYDGFAVTMASSVAEAFEILGEHSIDAIVSDYEMEDQNGVDFLSSLREQGSTTPFILFTGRGRENVAARAMNSGADVYVLKRGDPEAQFDDLAHKIEAAVERHRAERALEEQGELFRAITETTAVAVWMYRGGRIIYANPAAEEISGYSVEELTSMDIWELVHPEERARVRARGEKRLEGEIPPERYLVRTLRKDGTERVLDIYANNATISGSPAVIVTAVDITLTHQTEQALKKQEQSLFALLDALRDGVAILDMQGTVLYLNSAVCTMVGIRTAADAVGRNAVAFVHHDSTGDAFRDLQTIRRGIDGFPAEYAIVTVDGETRTVESCGRIVEFSGTQAIALSLRDITDQKRASTGAQEQERLNRELIAEMPEYILVQTRDGRIVFANAGAEDAFGYGCETDSLTGRNICSLVTQDTRETFTEHVKGVIEGKKTLPVEIMMTTGASKMPVILRATPITYQNEDAVLLVLTDITEQMVLERELEYHAAELKHFSESLSLINEKLKIMNSITRHDILNQLTVLLGYLEIAGEEAEGLSVLPYLGQVKRSALKIRELIEFTRDYQDIGVREPQWCNVQQEISSLNEPGATIVSDLGDLEVYADPLFGKVFYNLLDNTRRHGEKATTVRVEWHQTGDHAVILWEDNGIGVRPEDKEKIFTQGFGKNTGLGMFLSKEILAITGLEIRETGEFGKGARFEILIPGDRYRCSADDRNRAEDPV